MNNSTPKRQYRQLSDSTKQKISQTMQGRTKSYTHKEAIRKGMTDYWKTVPNRPFNNETYKQPN